MDISIRHIQGQEMLDALYELGQYSFHPSPPFQDKEEWLSLVRGRMGVRCHAVCEDKRPVSIVASSPMTQNIRGKLFPASGVWGVSSHPAVRRKGYCRQAMASLLFADREAGMVFSNLYPFRESFYERLGYVSYLLDQNAKFSISNLAPLLKMNLEGEIELKLIGEVYDAYRSYLAETRQYRHGMAFFDYPDQVMANRNRLWAAQARIDGKTEGFMLYSVQGEELTKFNFSVARFYYRSSRARYLLLNWIARHVDQADQVEMWLPPDENPETWLADLQVKAESAVRAAMGRVLDVEKIGGMNAGTGSFTARVTDPICPWNEGVWRFEGCDGKLVVSKAGRADCELAIQGLSALVAGTHDPQDFALRGWGNPEPDVQAVHRSLFPKIIPYLHEVF